MTLFELACAMINETPESIGAGAAEITAPGLINAYLLENEPLNRLLTGTEAGETPQIKSLSEEFPFDIRLAAPCTYYMCAGLVRDENSSISEYMLERADSLTGRAAAEVPAETAPIRDIYSGIN